jgi:hypothetical protein
LPPSAQSTFPTSGTASSSSSSSDGSFRTDAQAVALLSGVSAIQTGRNLALFALDCRVSTNWALQNHSDPPTYGESNAARHALWQALLTQDFGAGCAKGLGDLHERGSTNRTDSWIDQYNNQLGRALGQRNLTQKQLRDEIDRMIRDNELITDSCDNRIPSELRDCDHDDVPDCEQQRNRAPQNRADVNRDGVVDLQDVLETLANAGTDDPQTDQDLDCATDFIDVEIVIGRYNP